MIHEIQEGQYAWIGGMLFVRFNGMVVPDRVPDSIQVIHEDDHTLTLQTPMNVWANGKRCHAFLIHDVGIVVEQALQDSVVVTNDSRQVA